MGRNPYSTGYVASKIRENTARRNGASTSGEEQRLAAQTESIFDDLYGAEVAASYASLSERDLDDVNAMAYWFDATYAAILALLLLGRPVSKDAVESLSYRNVMTLPANERDAIMRASDILSRHRG